MGDIVTKLQEKRPFDPGSHTAPGPPTGAETSQPFESFSPWGSSHVAVYQQPQSTGGGGGNMEVRIARLESDVEHIKKDIGDIRSDIREIRNDAKSDFRWLFGLGIGAIVLIFSAMAKGFGWIKL